MHLLLIEEGMRVVVEGVRHMKIKNEGCSSYDYLI